MEEERREHVAKMNKMEQEMEQVFEMKVKEKLQKLRDSEAEVCCGKFLFSFFHRAPEKLVLLSKLCRRWRAVAKRGLSPVDLRIYFLVFSAPEAS